MNRDEAYERIDDYVDNLLDTSTREAFEARMADDGDLCGEVDSLMELKRQTGELPSSVLPERDLWPEIEAKIGRPASSVDFGFFRGRQKQYSVLRYVMAAAALVLLMLGVRAIVELDSAREALPPTPIVAEDPELNRIEREYAAAKEELLSELRAREASLPPETLAIVEENLTIIENAVSDISIALADNPENADLERMLHAAYQSEVNLLHQVVRLAGES